MNQNLYCLFQSRFPADKNRPFLQHERGRTTFADIEQDSARIAALLKHYGLNKGDHIVVQVSKSPECVLLYLACLRAGLIYIPLNTAYTAAEVDYFLSDAKPAMFVCDPLAQSELASIVDSNRIPNLLTLSGDGRGSLIEQLEDIGPDFAIAHCSSDDLASILYTSGTTGRSKGAMISHGNLASNAFTLHDFWQFQADDVLLHALPIFHVHGLFVALHCALLNASPVLFQTRFDIDQILAALPQATVLMGVPTFYVRLLDRDEFNVDLTAHMRLFISGSAPLLEDTFEQFEARTGQRILERYGMTETGMISSNPYDGERLAGTVGYALPDIEVRIVDDKGKKQPAGQVGVLEVKGPNVFSGYWQMPEKTAEEFRDDGYFITGDLATVDEDGRISIVGRSKDLIISGGYNIYPKEVEAQIDKIPGVRESAVIGLPHADFGEAVAAVIVLEGDASITTQSIKASLTDCLASFKLPRQVFIVDELPRNSMGKVQKNKLRSDYTIRIDTN